MSLRSPVVALVVLAAAATACSDDKKPARDAATSAATTTTGTSPGATTGSGTPPTRAPSGTPTGSDQARDELAELAGKAAAASYDATYDFGESVSGTKGALRIVSKPPSFRVDIKAGARTAQFYDIAQGSVACTVAGTTPTCLLVAKPGEPVPDLFESGVSDLFTTSLEGLRDNPEDFVVQPLPDSPATGGAGPGRCFAVERLTDLRTPTPGQPPTPGEGFETGEYCFDPASGVLVSVKLKTGALTLTKLGPEPTAKDFVPPATPSPIPSASATAPTP